jgi:hypothetical protein
MLHTIWKLEYTWKGCESRELLGMTVIAARTMDVFRLHIDNSKLNVIRASRHRPVPPYLRHESDDICTDVDGDCGV